MEGGIIIRQVMGAGHKCVGNEVIGSIANAAGDLPADIREAAVIVLKQWVSPGSRLIGIMQNNMHVEVQKIE